MTYYDTLDIAEALGKRHGDILSKIRDLFRYSEIAIEQYVSMYIRPGVGERPHYKLPIELAINVVEAFRINTGGRAELLETMYELKGEKVITQALRRPELNFLDSIVPFLKHQSIDFSTQHPVLDYRIDLFLPKENIAIEFDEMEHRYTVEKDQYRQARIESYLGCRFLRVPEDELIGVTISRLIKTLMTRV